MNLGWKQQEESHENYSSISTSVIHSHWLDQTPWCMLSRRWSSFGKAQLPPCCLAADTASKQTESETPKMTDLNGHYETRMQTPIEH